MEKCFRALSRTLNTVDCFKKGKSPLPTKANPGTSWDIYSSKVN